MCSPSASVRALSKENLLLTFSQIVYGEVFIDFKIIGCERVSKQTIINFSEVNINGKVLTMTGSADDTAVFTVGTHGTLSIVTNDSAGTNANIQITADGTAELAGTTVTLDSSGGITLDADGGTITFADGGSSLGTITSSGYSGTAATATALETARTIGGVSFDGTGNINLPGVNTSGNQNTSGTAAVATTITVADESSDTSCNVLFTTDATGNLAPKSGTNLTFNSNTGELITTSLTISGGILTMPDLTS